jgi:hypothetical protein
MRAHSARAHLGYRPTRGYLFTGATAGPSSVTAVVIGVDPHKLSATIEVVDERERVLGGGRFGTDRDGYRQMLAAGRRWPQRVRAVEGRNGIAPGPSCRPGARLV